MSEAPFLTVDNVTMDFKVGKRSVRALDGISLQVAKGACLAIVGESGSGKSTLANIVLGLYPPTTGSVALKGEVLPAKRALHHRRQIQLVQQNPLSALNPRRTIAASLRLALDVHKQGAPADRPGMVKSLLEEVGLDPDFAKRSPSALSGGQRQRVAIARALACRSDLIVLDEPTSALDVLVQARVLKLLEALRTARNLTYIFITHDLSVVRNIADHVAVFKEGRLVEQARTATLFANPRDPYTRALISAVPCVGAEEMALRDALQSGAAAPEASNETSQSLFQALEAHCDSLIGLKLFTCSIVDLKAGQAERIYTNDADAYPLSGLKDVIPNRWTKQVLDEGQAFLATNINELRDIFPDHEKIEALGLGATINLPIPLSADTIGTVNILDANNRYDASSLRSLDAIRDMAAKAFNAYLDLRRS